MRVVLVRELVRMEKRRIKIPANKAALIFSNRVRRERIDLELWVKFNGRC